MKLLKKLTPLATATSLAIGASTLPMVANAELSASLGVANMYLWRGQNLTPHGGQVHGGLQYDISGFYLGAWTSSEEGGHETDLYLGYGGEVGGFRYDVSYWNYLYPEDTVDEYTTDTTASPNVRTASGVKRGLNDTNQQEIAVALGWGPIDAAAYINVDGDTPDDNYFTISGTWKQFTLLYGFWDLESGTVKTADSIIKGTDGNNVVDGLGDDFLEGGADQYSHLTFTYAYNDSLSFSISKAFSDLDKDDDAAVNENLLFQAAYTWNFSMDK